MTSLVQSAIANQFCFLVEDMYIYLRQFWSAQMIAALVTKKKESNTVSYPKLFLLATD